ncbi:uncharacterized protein KY384_001069 [Bacidia gigantensis]|uniref:uncharacterized protein n=1 Tax=Bacidia gigantensis TaxID=2732470 RepID=UPI001D05887B|nr:uncharacterized protein KY384_001069 [Bacidia gigantensis]KAG8534225.1 hypothetical protein KY384_001069 [Bacidia gigantensis]
MESLHCVALLLFAFQLLFPRLVLTLPATLSSRQSTTIPKFVSDYAPLVWLESNDKYNPSDIGNQLVHTQPEKDFKVVAGAPNPLTLDNLDQLNGLDGANVYLTSSTDPPWLFGVRPEGSGKTVGATSCAVIVNDHGSGLVDAFYMYFYAFDFGGVYFGQQVGNHVGDWEHTMVRFQDAKPQAIWFSQHSFGEAFTYDTVEKQGIRPVAYSANGTHANYATSGTHDHTLPGVSGSQGLLEDHCDKGTLWDPLLGAYFYQFDASTQAFAAYDGSSPVKWLSFAGKFGDKQYPDSDPRQHKIFGIDATAKFTDGPTGPISKDLNRTDQLTIVTARYPQRIKASKHPPIRPFVLYRHKSSYIIMNGSSVSPQTSAVPRSFVSTHEQSHATSSTNATLDSNGSLRRKSSFNFLRRTKSRDRSASTGSAPQRKLSKKESKRMREEEIKRMQNQIPAGPPRIPVVPSQPQIQSFGGEGAKQVSASIMSNRAAGTFPQRLAQKTSQENIGANYYRGMPVPPVPPVPPIPGHTAGGFGDAGESMANRGRYSYASSAISTINSPRKIRRRKDPIPFK